MLKITDKAKDVLLKRYVDRDANGVPIETVDGMFDRVAKVIAAAEKTPGDREKYKREFEELMTSLKFLPNSPTLINAGRALGELSACFVLPVEDSMGAIFETIKNTALIHQSGGGTGFSFSRVREKNSKVSSTGGEASGPISFMKVFNSATDVVKQGGVRRGANMACMRVDHPDIMDFITCKQDNNDLTNFNISVAITDKFMTALFNKQEYELVSPRDGKVKGKLKAAEVWKRIVDNAYHNGDPGMLFIDKINEYNPLKNHELIESTNPCGEQPLLPNESCNLGSINLVGCLKHVQKDKKYIVDYVELKRVTRLAVRFLDNVIDVNKYPIDAIRDKTLETRKIGLGIMGFADALIKMNLRYGSKGSITTCEEIMSFVTKEARLASEELAKERGPFPLWDKVSAQMMDIFGQAKPVRNMCVTTIAPTGTLSLIANCSSGIEPVFSYAYKHAIMDKSAEEGYWSVNDMLRELLESTDRKDVAEEVYEYAFKNGTLHGAPHMTEAEQNVFVSTHDIPAKSHIAIQAAFQKYTDNAISKTINFKNSATRAEVERSYLLAYETGCKGITVYRDGSRDEQVLNTAKTTKTDKHPTKASKAASNAGADAAALEQAVVKMRMRPDVTVGATEKIPVGCGRLYVTVNWDELGICEVMTTPGKSGGCPSQSQATARLVSMALRSGISIEEIIDQLKGIRCPSTTGKPGMRCLSCPDALARILEKATNGALIPGMSGLPETKANKNRSVATKHATSESLTDKKAMCPECGEVLEQEGGCNICRNCGYSKCG